MFRMVGLIAFLGLTFAVTPAHGVKLRYKTLKRRAYFSPEKGSGLYSPMDLRRKRYTFTPTDHEICGRVLVRDQGSLSYSCTLELPTRSSNSKLREHQSDRELTINFGGMAKKVRVRVSRDARYVTFSTGFDVTGLDFDTASFNDEFFPVYAKAAQLIIGEAMNSQKLQIKVLEN